MKHMRIPQKAFILTLSLVIIILCGAILFTVMNKSANTVALDFDDLCKVESIEFANQLSHLDKVDHALVLIEPLNNEIDRVYITVQVEDEINHSEIDNISNYIGSHFEELDEDQILISYLDSSYNLRHSVPELTN